MLEECLLNSPASISIWTWLSFFKSGCFSPSISLTIQTYLTQRTRNNLNYWRRLFSNNFSDFFVLWITFALYAENIWGPGAVFTRQQRDPVGVGRVLNNSPAQSGYLRTRAFNQYFPSDFEVNEQRLLQQQDEMWDNYFYSLLNKSSKFVAVIMKKQSGLYSSYKKCQFWLFFQ